MTKPSAGIYLDYAAATPLDKRVLAAMQPYFAEQFYNPSAGYQAARQVSQTLTTARAQVAAWLGARPTEIVFVAGGSEANNLAIHGVMRQYPAANVVVSAIEHESVLKAAGRYDCRLAPVGTDGVVDLVALEKLIDDNTVLVSVMYANNEIGTVQPVRQIAGIIKSKRAERSSQLPLYLHSDAAQATNYLDLHVSRLGVDLMSLNGGKIYGPKQSGALYVRAGVSLTPLIDGGGQEWGLRSGTENVAGAVGFAAALELTQAGRHSEVSRLQKLQKQAIDELLARLPQARLNGSRTKRLPNNVNLTLSSVDNERLLMQLDQAGIMAAAGSACSASSVQPSHVLAAIGLTDEEARSSLRLSFGRSTTPANIEQLIKTLVRLLD